MRRVVTTDVAGRSRVLTDGPVARTWCEEVWASKDGDGHGHDPGAAVQPIEPEPGGTRFRVVTLLPDREIRAMLTSGSAGEEHPNAEDAGTVNEDGFHRTATLDYVFVLDGPVELVLDDESVVVQPGDAVVQRGTNHAWRNHGDKPIRLLAVMVSAPL